jgi:uncharacterized protein (TIGR02646 family)
MRAITKGPEPGLLKAYRAVPGATYDGKDFTPVKEAVRGALIRDQYALCCYCMRRISSDEKPHPAKLAAPSVVQMKVEHWRSQVSYPTIQLSWSNLLGACLGNMGSSPKDQTCDTRKGEDAITFNPLDLAHISTLYCTSAGRLCSTNPQFQDDIDDRLGLNHKTLIGDREARLTREINRLINKTPKGSISPAAVQQLIAEVETPTDGRLREHACVLRLWARKRFSSRAQ